MRSAVFCLLLLALASAYEPSTQALKQPSQNWCRSESSRFEPRTICHTLMSVPTHSYAEGSMILSLSLRSTTKSNSKCMSTGDKKTYTCLLSIVKGKKLELSSMKIIKEFFLIESSIWPPASPLLPKRVLLTLSGFYPQAKSPNLSPCSIHPPCMSEMISPQKSTLALLRTN